jgi:RHH-type proline utilization regulon transcriptional repressor/proline dehydrogenase/delta 1-pyrroline-5-carboxylate dehydrogenase
MNHFKAAEQILHQARAASFSPQELEKQAIELAGHMLEEAVKTQTRREKKMEQELSALMDDPKGKAFTMSMTDQCFRSHRTFRIADQLVFLLKSLGIPRYLSPFRRFSLQCFQLFGKWLHFLLVPMAKWTLRHATSRVILPGEKRSLAHHMHLRRKQGVRLNINHLGEAILGEQEAISRLNVYLEDLKSEDIEYVSIKISTIFSQINILDWDKTIEILEERLSLLYKTAKEHTFKRADGTTVPKFVNLDMEEYRDLHLTKELFKKILSQPRFLSFSAGIVLQAYLPDSFAILQELTLWAKERRQHGGAPIKVRIVKGANLAMEQVEASLQTWSQTPYKTKQEVDANFKRMILHGCQKENASAVHIGVGSHNLFDIAYAMLLRAEQGVFNEVSFEMLEGMADHLRRVVQRHTGSILLYCPVATEKDFQSAIAYLIRRLDENTGPENFLRHSFGLRTGGAKWNEQVALFSKAYGEMQTVSAKPRRLQNRAEPAYNLPLESPFSNEIETDLSLPQNHRWAYQLVSEWRGKTFLPIPLVIDGEEIHEAIPQGQGVDPSYPHTTLYTYSQATWEQIDEAIACAKRTEPSWAKKSGKEIALLLRAVAPKMREARGDLIGVMMRDGGKTYAESEPEVAEAIDFAEYYLRQRLELDAQQELSLSPKGTILVTPPWNFPISIPAGGILAALATGNCVLFKPAPEAVLSGWVLVNLFWQAGIPKEVLQFVNCPDDPVGSRLICDPRINTIILTGGTSTARLFMKMRPSLDLAAETGGKNAMIITGMADRDLAIKNLVQSAFGHSGQKCSAASLAILEAEVYDDPHFMAQLKDAVESLPVGSNWNLCAKVIPMIRPPSKALLQALTMLDPGESWLVHPHADSGNPHLWSPGVKLGVTKGSFMHQTELFGPVLGIMRAKNLREAIQLANSTPYGLTAGLQSLDEREIKIWMETIQAGNCYINRTMTGAIVLRQPFGGVKASSFGRGFKAGGPYYLSQFMHKTQSFLPSERASVNKKIEALSALAEKLGKQDLWQASIGSYAFWAEKYRKDVDPVKLVGEDNILRHRPRSKMAFRVQGTEDPVDVLRVLAAALSCEAELFVSVGPSFSLKLPGAVKEKEENFLKRVDGSAFERIRLLSAPSEQLLKVAAERGCYLDTEPVLASGKFELLHYLHEISISYDYHRYGNLGLREAEPRKPIL